MCDDGLTQLRLGTRAADSDKMRGWGAILKVAENRFTRKIRQKWHFVGVFLDCSLRTGHILSLFDVHIFYTAGSCLERVGEGRPFLI